MTNRDRFKNIMSFKEVDRIPRIEFAGYWDETIKRWISEGLDSGRTGEIELRDDFGLDDYRQFWIEPYSASCAQPVSHGAPIIHNADDYRYLRNELFPDSPWDINDLEAAADGQRQGKTVVWNTFEGFFWFPRYLLGIEKHLYSFYDHPELIHMINDELADYHCRNIERFNKTCIPDFMSFAEDLSYNMGPMISRDLFDEFLLPYYKRVLPSLDAAGTLSFIDTDGAVTDIIPWFQSAGFKGCLPIECNADNNPAVIRRLYPDWLMIGGVEKRKISADTISMKQEVQAKFKVARKGGYIPSVDHQTPPEVSLSQYRNYIDFLWKYSSSHGI